jgi:hypothetical protein
MEITSADSLTDASLVKLAAMPHLQHLRVYSCRQLTSAGMEAFQKARPDVTLIH